jgi:hypothetical protein
MSVAWVKTEYEFIVSMGGQTNIFLYLPASIKTTKMSLQMKKILSILGISLFTVTAMLFMPGCSKEGVGSTYYVSPNGIDTNNGTSLITPVQTITKSLSLAINSGDIVYVATGAYLETVRISRSGITLTAYPGNKPIIDGTNLSTNGNWGALVYMDGNNNLISGFEVRNSNITGSYVGGFGILSVGSGNVISFVNNHHTWQQGIWVTGDYNIVQDSKIWQAALVNSATPGTGWSPGLSASRNHNASALIPGITSYADLRRNIVFNNWGEGLDCYESDHCTIEDNIVYDNWAVDLYLSDATNSLVQRNIVYTSSAPAIPSRNSISGLSLADEVAAVPRSTNNTIINNFIYNINLEAFHWTLVNNSGLNNTLIANNTIVDGILSTGIGGSPAIVNTNSQIRNNIILGTKSQVPGNSGITFSNNNWGMTPPLAADVTDIVGDPQIARTGTTAPGTLTGAYFEILGSSPLINAATPLSSVTTDFFQFTRGAKPSIGGYEFNINNPKVKAIDSTAPSAPTGLVATANATTINLAWNASTDNVGVAGYRIYRSGTEIGASPVTSSVDTAVVKGVSYSYRVKAYDAAGNLSAASNTATMIIPLPVQVSITSSYPVTIANTSNATINWTTNIPATGVVAYGTSPTKLNLTVRVSQLLTSQAALITGLVSGITYYYNISVNSGQTTALSKTFSFKK